MAASSTSRWCPTQEQVMILEELYIKGGIKTPNAFQIQQITTHLSLYGKIEGKNVFYWFQNHKARERQKLRRKLMQNHKQLHFSLHHHQHQPSWYHYSVPFAAHSTPFHQGQRAAGSAGHQDSFTGPQSNVHASAGTFQHGFILADKLSPCCTIGQAPLKTLELFPLKSSHFLNNSNQNPDKE